MLVQPVPHRKMFAAVHGAFAEDIGLSTVRYFGTTGALLKWVSFFEGASFVVVLKGKPKATPLFVGKSMKKTPQ